LIEEDNTEREQEEEEEQRITSKGRFVVMITKKKAVKVSLEVLIGKHIRILKSEENISESSLSESLQ
jgi:hypothetical protein